jgi:ribosomal protein S16
MFAIVDVIVKGPRLSCESNVRKRKLGSESTSLGHWSPAMERGNVKVSEERVGSWRDGSMSTGRCK